MKLKILNVLSGSLFFISSASLLSVPFLDLKKGFNAITYILAGVFWFGLIFGIVIQIILANMCRGLPTKKDNKLYRIIGKAFLVLLIALIPVIMLFNNNRFVLPVNLFLLVLSAEAYWVLRQMGRLDEYEKYK